MGARSYFTAFRMLPGFPFWRQAGCRRKYAGTFLSALFCTLLLPGCASVDVLMLSSESFSTQPGQVQMLERAPTRPYVRIAVLSVDSWWLSVESKREKVLEKAATLGADAVVFGDPLLSPSHSDNRTAGPSSPAPSSPPAETEHFLPDDLHPSSLQEGRLNDNVKVFLVRGGGHGGGRGGAHRHGGHWRGHSGHSGFRHWGRFYGPGYWGYGFYGPGWWGYGPYWGRIYPYSYDPSYGGYPYSSYGYVNTITFGTAIRYTD